MEQSEKAGEGKGGIGRALAMFAIMFKIGLFTWGGGWSIVAQMQKDFVEKRKWFSHQELVDFICIARSLPGVLTINISVIAGKTLGGLPGALLGAIGITLPSVVVLIAVSALLTAYSEAPLVLKALAGVRAAIVPIVVMAAWRMLKSAVVDKVSLAVMLASFALALFTPFSKLGIIAAGGVVGLVSAHVLRGIAKAEDAR